MNTNTTQPANFTRRTADLSGKFRRKREFGFLALYHLLRLSDLGKEGIERSGSYRFADHIYADRASGRGVVGRVLDRLLLNLPATRALRQRCAESTAAMHRALFAHEATRLVAPFRILTVPCGLPRDVANFADSIGAERPLADPRFEYTGMDLDPEVVTAARDFLAHAAVRQARWVEGDALSSEAFPPGEFHFISSTGLGEFLDDSALLRFYANVHRHLASGGVFFTSATAHEPRSDALLQAFELRSHYRNEPQMAALLETLSWRTVRYTHDRSGLQTFIYATKE